MTTRLGFFSAAAAGASSVFFSSVPFAGLESFEGADIGGAGEGDRARKWPNPNLPRGATSSLAPARMAETKPKAAKPAVKVEFAPISLPLERRLQTFSLLVAMMLFPATMLLLSVLVWSDRLHELVFARYAVAAYLVWMLGYDRTRGRRGGRPVTWVQRWRLWKYVCDYFPSSLHLTAPLDAAKPHIIGIHPHGIIGVGALTNVVMDASGQRERLGVDLRILTVSINFFIPLWRDLIMALGFVDASRESIAYLLERNKSVAIVVGGAAEALDAEPGTVDLVLDRRKGFIELALQHGASLVPAFTFGENELWDTVKEGWLLRFQRALGRVLKFTTPIFYGRGIFFYSFGFLPHRRALHTVLGAPIPVERVAEPTEAQVDALHAQYIAALEALYYAHRDEFAPGDWPKGRKPPPSDHKPRDAKFRIVQ